MGLFDLFKPKHDPNKKFVSEADYQANKSNQSEMTPATLQQLIEIGVTEANQLKLEYFFYTNNIDKAKNLAAEIQKMDYTVEVGPSAGDKNNFVINGWSNKMVMNDSTVTRWAEQMCDLGFKYDCEFDGWGTTPDQD